MGDHTGSSGSDSGQKRDLLKAAIFFVAAIALIVGLKIVLGY